MTVVDNIMAAVSQPICLVTKSSKQITFLNPAMGKLFGIVTDESTNEMMFNDYFSFIDLIFHNVFEDANYIYDEKPVLIKLLKKSSKQFFNAYFSQLDDNTIILLLTPNFLSNSIIENPFLRNHENTVDLIENAPIAINIKKISGEYIWANKFQQKLLGYSNDELVGKNINEVSYRVRYLKHKLTYYILIILITNSSLTINCLLSKLKRII